MKRQQNHKLIKLANAIIYFIDKDVQDLGTTKLMKLFYFADKFHINETTKPIFNYDYVKKPRGPVLSEIHSIIKSIQVDSEDDDYEESDRIFKEYITVKRVDSNSSNTIFTKNREFDSRYFSQKEIEVLDSVVLKFKNISKDEISELSYKENSWKKAKLDEKIEFFDMADSSDIRDYIISKEQENLQLKKYFK
jgi:uncharacterized phage-associated protein